MHPVKVALIKKRDSKSEKKKVGPKQKADKLKREAKKELGRKKKRPKQKTERKTRRKKVELE